MYASFKSLLPPQNARPQRRVHCSTLCCHLHNRRLGFEIHAHVSAHFAVEEPAVVHDHHLADGQDNVSRERHWTQVRQRSAEHVRQNDALA